MQPLLVLAWLKIARECIILVLKRAYLTIDDAPSIDTRRKVDFLASRGISAIWFCRGEFLEKAREQAIHIIENGFVIGNHSYDHPHFSKLDVEQCIDQVERTDGLIKSVYADAGMQRPVKLFRFPFGDKGGSNATMIQEHLRKMGYTQPKFEGITYDWYLEGGIEKDVDVFWTYDAMDWRIRDNSLEKALGRMDEDDPANGLGLNRPGSAEIIVMHDFRRTKDWFIPMIERLLEKNLTFASPTFI